MEELLRNPLKLYRDALRLALYLSGECVRRCVQGLILTPVSCARSSAKNEVPQAGLVAQVRASFRKHQHETDPEKVNAARLAAVRGLHSFLMSEATDMAKKGASPYAPEDAP